MKKKIFIFYDSNLKAMTFSVCSEADQNIRDSLMLKTINFLLKTYLKHLISSNYLQSKLLHLRHQFLSKLFACLCPRISTMIYVERKRIFFIQFSKVEIIFLHSMEKNKDDFFSRIV